MISFKLHNSERDCFVIVTHFTDGKTEFREVMGFA